MISLVRKIGLRTIKAFSDAGYRSRLKAHARFLPQLTLQEDRNILHGLEREGACISSIEKLNMPSGKSILDEAQSLIPEIIAKNTNDKKAYISHATEAQLMEHYRIILWGLEERFLSIVENYLGLPVSYRGLTFRKDVVNGQNAETRLWHKDAEDYRILKIIVYLNDVDTNGGPFMYIPKYLAPADEKLTWNDGRVTDENMKKVVPESQWVECRGKAGTVVLADPCSILHKGKMPTDQDRFTLFYCYNSGHPLRPQYCTPLFSREEFLKRASPLSERQKQSIA